MTGPRIGLWSHFGPKNDVQLSREIVISRKMIAFVMSNRISAGSRVLTRRFISHCVNVTLLIVGITCITEAAEQQTAKTPDSKIDPLALTELLRMTDFVVATQHFSFTVHASYDVLQEDGQKLEFPESRRVAVSRPDHVRGDIIDSEGAESVITFDGKQLTLYNKSDQVCATTETVGTIDSAIEKLTNEFGIRMPLAMLINSKLTEIFRGKITAADKVGTSTLTGTICTHLTARSKDVDLQVWVQEGEQPLPRRIVLTYRNEPGMPQYRADLTDWKIMTARDDAKVTYKVPPGSEQFDFQAAIPSEIRHGNSGRKGKI